MNRVRDPILILGGVLALGIAALGGLSSSQWVGQPFPGFLLLENGVVASAGLAHWPAVSGGEIYQQELLAYDGRSLEDADALRSYVAGLPVGTEVTYRLVGGVGESVRVIPTRAFRSLDFWLLFGSYLVCGLGLTGVALGIRFLGGRDPAARGSAASLWLIGMWALTATDLYGPYRLFAMHAFLECLLFAATLHLALVFPEPRGIAQRFPALVPLLYGLGGALGVATVMGMDRPASYVLTHRVAIALFGGAMIALIASQLATLIRPASFQARQRVKVLALGTAAALTPQVLLSIAAVNGAQASENLMGWSGIFFPLSIGYAVLKSDLLQVDEILRSTAKYAALTLAVAVGYAGIVAGIEVFYRGGMVTTGWGPAFVFALVSLAILLPLRDLVQSAVDRVFFRSAYDFRMLVEGTSRRLASVTNLGVIVNEIEQTVAEALRPESVRFEVRAPEELELSAAAVERCISQEEASRLVGADGRAVELDNGGLGLAFVAEGRLVALLVLGRRLGGGFYGAEDRRLLHTLANQGAVAIENVLAVQRVRDLNRSLERRVADRTKELAEALRALQETQRQMVHQEKMASIGQLVAGVAHEINNPINFIKGNICLLREYTDGLVGALAAYEDMVRSGESGSEAAIEAVRQQHDVDYVMKDLASLLDSCDEGVERTTTIVRDLRTFSRADGGVPVVVDLAERLDTTLNLLRSRLTGIDVVRDYGDAGSVECLEGQLDQVFMNLIVNAADSMQGDGRIVIRSRHLGEDRVVIEVDDNGCGIPADELERVFEPFFTTKDPGKGTGLGLAISYGVVSRHGGRIYVRSWAGEGTCFSVELSRTFPRGQTDSDFTVPPRAGGAAASGQGGGPMTTQPKILVVDDEPRAVELLVRTLRKEATMETAQSANEAWISVRSRASTS